MSPGDRVVLLDNSGSKYITELESFSNDLIEGRIVSVSAGDGEPRTQITLYQSLLKGDKMDWVLQKGTELGAAGFVPLLSRRSVPRSNRSEQQLVRWTRIVTEAAEQSGRSRLPQVHPVVSLPEACRQLPSGLSLIPYEDERERSMREMLLSEDTRGPVSIFIGPEGGWDPEEVVLARAHGIMPVSLGQRVLRAETAAIAAITVAMYSRGELGQ